MKRVILATILMSACLNLGQVQVCLSQGNPRADGDLTRLLVESYDLLEAGKLAEAQAIFARILKKAPDNPLALNNYGALLVKQGKDAQGLKYLEKALPLAKGYKVKVNRVCEVNRLCLAFRPLQAEYGDQELEPLIKLNIEMVRAKAAAKPPKSN